jgi:hypothetical protein
VDRLPGPVESELLSYGNRKATVEGLVFGPFGETSKAVDNLLQFIATHMHHKRTSGGNSSEYARASVLNEVRSRIGLLVHRGWAQVLIGRANLLVEGRDGSNHTTQNIKYKNKYNNN